jgi:cyclase
LDVKDGRVVKGVRFLDLKDAGDPVECARAYDRDKADELVFLDITASHENRKTVLEMVEKVAENIYIPFTVGGGIRKLDDIRELLKAGCDKVSLNTFALENESLVSEASLRFGAQCIVIAIDSKRDKSGVSAVYSHGGRKATRWETVRWAVQAEKLGAGEILLTSMDADGTRNGYDLDLTRAVADAVRIPVIASGGAGEMRHLFEALTAGGADAVLAASIFHYGDISIPAAKQYLREKGIAIRT